MVEAEPVEVEFHRRCSIEVLKRGPSFEAFVTDPRGRPLGRFRGRDPERVTEVARQYIERISTETP